MAENEESPIILKLRELMMGTPAMQDQANTKLASTVDASTDTPKNYAEGGPVMDPQLATGQMPGVPALPGFEPTEDEKLKAVLDEMIKNPRPQPSQEQKKLEGTAGPNLAHGGVAAPNDNTPHKAPEGPSHEEKMEAVMKALSSGELKMADGGVPPVGPLPADASPEDKMGVIAKLMGAAGNIFQSPAGKMAQFAADPVGSATSLIAPRVAPAIDTAKSLANPVINTMNAVGGTHVPNVPQEAPVPAPQAASTPAPEVPSTPVQAPKIEAPPVAPHMTDFNALFNQDPSKIAPGLNAPDRQKAAGDVWNQQHTIGGMISEALTGLGDAVAARGGINQDMLSKVISLQGDRRKEVMDNFDKARETAVQNFNLKAQMGKNAIDMLAAKDAYGPASPALIKLLNGMGVQVTPGTLNKDLPMYFQAAKAQADKAVSQGEMLLKATKQASDEIEASNKDSGLLHMKMGPEEMAKHVKYRAAELMAQAQGMVHVRTSDGAEHFMPAANVEKAKQMDRGLKVLN